MRRAVMDYTQRLQCMRSVKIEGRRRCMLQADEAWRRTACQRVQAASALPHLGLGLPLTVFWPYLRHLVLRV